MALTKIKSDIVSFRTPLLFHSSYPHMFLERQYYIKYKTLENFLFALSCSYIIGTRHNLFYSALILLELSRTSCIMFLNYWNLPEHTL